MGQIMGEGGVKEGSTSTHTCCLFQGHLPLGLENPK